MSRSVSAFETQIVQLKHVCTRSEHVYFGAEYLGNRCVMPPTWQIYSDLKRSWLFAFD